MSTETDPNIVWKMALLILYCMYILYVGRAIIITCWYWFLHTCLKPCGVNPWGAGGTIESQDDGRPVAPIFSIGGPGRLCQPNNTGTPGLGWRYFYPRHSDLPTALRNRDGNELNKFFIVIEDVKKIQKQNRYILQKQEIESKKHYEEIQNQTKQLNLLQNLVLDLKNSQSSKKKAEELETELITGNCVVCLDKPLTHAVRPCGHLIACTDCAEKLSKKCPICRRPIFATLRIFLP
jgi:hypothetical protein